MSYGVTSIGLRRRNPPSTPLPGVDAEGARPLKTHERSDDNRKENGKTHGPDDG